MLILHGWLVYVNWQFRKMALFARILAGRHTTAVGFVRSLGERVWHAAYRMNFKRLQRNLVVVIAVISMIFSTHIALAYFDSARVFVYGHTIEWNNTKENNGNFVVEPMPTGYIVASSAIHTKPIMPTIKSYARAQKILATAPETPRSKQIFVTMSAYSSTKDQTDASPFITASGTHVRDGIIATNLLPMGTRIRIPEYYGDKVFTVEDRMHSRHQKKVDIWMPSRSEAMRFGRRSGHIEVVE